MDKIVIGTIANIMDYSPFWYAEARQTFAKHGLQAQVEVTNSVQAALDGVKSGAFDLALGTPEGVILQAGPGSDLVMVAGTTTKLMLSLMGAPGITRMQDLAGKTVGASSATEGTSLLMLEMLSQAGVDIGTVAIQPIGVGAVRLEALKEGRISAGMLNVPANYEAVNQGLNLLGHVPDHIPAYQFATLNVRRAWLRDPKHAEMAQRVLAALREAIRAVYDPANTELMVDLTARKMKVSPAAARQGWQDLLRLKPMAADLEIDPAAFAKTVATMKKAGTLPAEREVRLEQVFDRSLLDRLDGR